MRPYIAMRDQDNPVILIVQAPADMLLMYAGTPPSFPGCSAQTIFIGNGETAPVGCNVCILSTSRITLNCTAFGSPPITYRWTEPNGVVTEQPLLRASAEGQYRCLASNADDTDGINSTATIFREFVRFNM